MALKRKNIRYLKIKSVSSLSLTDTVIPLCLIVQCAVSLCRWLHRRCGRPAVCTAVLMISAVSWVERTACCGTGCSRAGSARNGLQVRVSVGTQCSHQQRQRYSYSTAGTLCYFVAAVQDLPLHFTLNSLPQLYSISLALFLLRYASVPLCLCGDTVRSMWPPHRHVSRYRSGRG